MHSNLILRLFTERVTYFKEKLHTIKNNKKKTRLRWKSKDKRRTQTGQASGHDQKKQFTNNTKLNYSNKTNKNA